MRTKTSIASLMIACAILLSCVPFSGYAQKGEGIHFENDSFKVLLALAKKENKIVFIDAYTSWCGPCKWMAQNVFTNDTVGEIYNKNFICAEFDMEKGEGPSLANKYEVNCYPTFLFIDGDGNLIHRESGIHNAQNFIKLGEDAMNPEEQFCILQKKYESGTATTYEFIRFMEMRSATCLKNDEQMAHYDSAQTEADLASEKNWAVLYSLVTDLNSRMFRYFIAHRDAYIAKHTADSVSQVISHVYGNAMWKCLSNKEGVDIAEYKKLRAEVAAFNMPALNQLLIGGDISFYNATKDWDKYAQATMLYVDKYALKDDWMLLNNLAMDFYENVDNADYLDTAIAWAKQSIAIEQNCYNTDTYAALLYKRGSYDEALIQIKIALRLAKKEKETDVSDSEEMLKKIKAAKKKK